jgi:hypothetical protein
MGSARPRSRRCSRRLAFELLEDRRVLATLTVTTLADAAVTGPESAPGTLRQAIYDANVASDADVIEFAAGLMGNVNLTIVDDSLYGATGLVISSPITIRGNANGISIARDPSVNELRPFRVTATGNLTLETISVAGGIVRGANGATDGENGGNALGGALYNQGTVQIISSTIHANQAIGGTAGAGGSMGVGSGGAIYNDEGELHIENSTFSENTAVRSDGMVIGCYGGAIFSKNGTVAIYNSTLTNSTAVTGRGLYVLSNNGTADVEIRSSIIGQSDTAHGVQDLVIAWDVIEQFAIAGSNNLIRRHNIDQLAFKNSNLEQDPQLGPLLDNGGPTLTHALLLGSPGIDQGNNSQDLAADQRGGSYVRVIGVAADIGAYESQTAVAPALPGDYNRNNIVDAADYVLWRRTRGDTVPKYSGADGNGNGEVGDEDYVVWRSHFGDTPSMGSAAPISPAGETGIENVLGESGSRVEAGGSRGVGIFFVTSLPINESPSRERGELAADAAGIGVRFQDPMRNLLVLQLATMAHTTDSNVISSAIVASETSSAKDDEAIVDAVLSAWPTVFASKF